MDFQQAATMVFNMTDRQLDAVLASEGFGWRSITKGVDETGVTHFYGIPQTFSHEGRTQAAVPAWSASLCTITTAAEMNDRDYTLSYDADMKFWTVVMYADDKEADLEIKVVSESISCAARALCECFVLTIWREDRRWT